MSEEKKPAEQLDAAQTEQELADARTQLDDGAQQLEYNRARRPSRSWRESAMRSCGI